jgi:hypothetical protein
VQLLPSLLSTLLAVGEDFLDPQSPVRAHAAVGDLWLLYADNKAIPHISGQRALGTPGCGRESPQAE